MNSVPDLELWLADHELAIHRRVEKWVRGGLPVPVALLRELWVDPRWQRALRAAFVGVAERFEGPVRVLGLLEEIGENGVTTAGFDGGREVSAETELVFPHYRDFADRDAALALLREQRGVRHSQQVERDTLRVPLNKYDYRRASDAVRERLARTGLAPFREGVESEVTPGHSIEQAVRVRVYRHPGHGDRPFAWLLTDAEAIGADLYAKQLGCTGPQVSQAVASAYCHPLLGFPAWSVRHDTITDAEVIGGMNGLMAARQWASNDDPEAASNVLDTHAFALPVQHRAAFWTSAAYTIFDSGTGFYWTKHSDGVKHARTEILAACRRSGLFADVDLHYAVAVAENADLEAVCDAIALRDGPEAALLAYRAVALRHGASASHLAKLRDYAAAAGRDRLTEDTADLGAVLAQRGYLFGLADSLLKNRKRAITHLVLTDDHAVRTLFSEPYELHTLDKCGVLDTLLKNKKVLERLRGGVLWPGSSAAEWVDEQFGTMFAESPPETAGYRQARRIAELLVPEAAVQG
ncbi:hypothetical protein [Nocardia yamanashiensis]|uniref:hypothetical protein n=1 Tax=Nocardia yamanashiensis TaxID=209247 RepID=UPI00082D689E|nr:hypothetical protein [Nocardia yamanashiensis]